MISFFFKYKSKYNTTVLHHQHYFHTILLFLKRRKQNHNFIVINLFSKLIWFTLDSYKIKTKKLTIMTFNTDSYISENQIKKHFFLRTNYVVCLCCFVKVRVVYIFTWILSIFFFFYFFLFEKFSSNFYLIIYYWFIKKKL